MYEKYDFVDREGVRYDPQEQDRDFRSIIKQAEKEAEKEVTKQFGGELPMMIGICHSIWSEQKRILKEKYNINWKTPAEMNPEIQFD